MDSEQILFDFTGKNICRSRIFRWQKFCGLPEGRPLRNALSVNGTQKQNAFSGASARFRIPAAFSSISFLPRQKRYGPRSGGDGAANRSAPPAHTKHASGSIPRHSDAEPPTEAEEIGREGQNLHNLQKSTLDNDRKIRMIILSHNRSTGRRGKNRPV